MPSFMTLSQYKVDLWKLVIAPTLSSQVGTYNLRVRNYIAADPTQELFSTLVVNVICNISTYLEPTQPAPQVYAVGDPAVTVTIGAYT